MSPFAIDTVTNPVANIAGKGAEAQTDVASLCGRPLCSPMQ